MSEYNDYIKEKLEPFGKITIKKMFGGFGVFRNDKIIGIIAYGQFYLKCAKGKEQIYIDNNCERFIYTRKCDGKNIKFNYWSISEDILEDVDTLRDFMKNIS